MGHHSTSDDSFAYRPRSEVEDRKRIDNPILRFRLFLEKNGWWNADAEEELKARQKAEVMKAFKRAETIQRSELGELFTDVYAGEQPWNLVCPYLKWLEMKWLLNMARRKSNGKNSLICSRSTERLGNHGGRNFRSSRTTVKISSGTFDSECNLLSGASLKSLCRSSSPVFVHH